ncbi:MAG: hypothetical protein SGPRY_013888, partial [Prymnesium sp.]
ISHADGRGKYSRSKGKDITKSWNTQVAPRSTCALWLRESSVQDTVNLDHAGTHFFIELQHFEGEFKIGLGYLTLNAALDEPGEQYEIAWYERKSRTKHSGGKTPAFKLTKVYTTAGGKCRGLCYENTMNALRARSSSEEEQGSKAASDDDGEDSNSPDEEDDKEDEGEEDDEMEDEDEEMGNTCSKGLVGKAMNPSASGRAQRHSSLPTSSAAVVPSTSDARVLRSRVH